MSRLDKARLKLRGRYLGRLPASIMVLRNALDDAIPDRGVLRDISHKLRGSGGTYGFDDITAAAIALQEAAPEQVRERALELIAACEAAIATQSDEEQPEVSAEVQFDPLTLLEHAPFVVMQSTPEQPWQFGFVSTNIEQVLGWSPSEFTSGARTFASLFQVADDFHHLDRRVRALLGSPVNRYTHPDYALAGSDGHRWISHTVVLQRDARQGVTGLVSYLTDVTRRRQNDIDRREQHAPEVETLAFPRGEQNHDLAPVSTAIRIPLNAILHRTQALERDGELTSGQRNHVQIIGRSGEHILRLIDRVETAPESVDLFEDDDREEPPVTGAIKQTSLGLAPPRCETTRESDNAVADD